MFLSWTAREERANGVGGRNYQRTEKYSKWIKLKIYLCSNFTPSQSYFSFFCVLPMLAKKYLMKKRRPRWSRGMRRVESNFLSVWVEKDGKRMTKILSSFGMKRPCLPTTVYAQQRKPMTMDKMEYEWEEWPESFIRSLYVRKGLGLEFQ